MWPHPCSQEDLINIITEGVKDRQEDQTTPFIEHGDIPNDTVKAFIEELVELGWKLLYVARGIQLAKQETELTICHIGQTFGMMTRILNIGKRIT